MKKIININFQGRVIPIEESAYETLKQYVDSLRKYFANEEGRDEIINDIESRIAELFSERLKRGSACIADEDINAVISSIGRPQDFDEQTGAPEVNTNTNQSNQQSNQNYTSGSYATGNANIGRGRLHRNADDKIIGGVCSGLANYLGIDPVIMRVIFVILFGALFWVYILLWIIVPSQSLQTNITKRLYRNADDKVLAGVCGGLASYFNIETWIPRLIFALPLIIGLISVTMNAVWWSWDFGNAPRIVTGSLSSTLLLTYIILWIAVPYASTASEKLEMRGEKVDLNSIRDTVKEDLESFKTKAEKWGQEVKQTAQNFGQNAGTRARGFAAEAAPFARRASSGAGEAIGMIFKAFFLFIAGIIAISLFAVLIALIFGGMAAFPLKNFVLESPTQNILAWATLIFFLGVPLVGLITWLIRRIMGVRSKNNYLGYTFGGLWVLGWFCVIFLIGTFANNFKVSMPVEDKISIAPPTSGKLFVDVSRSNLQYYHGDWFGFRFNDDIPVYGVNMDTLMLNTVRVRIVKSKDTSFHATRVRVSQGKTREIASQNAENIHFNIEQQDSTLLLPEGFAVSSSDKFRNQKVVIFIEVPVGKRIQMSNRLDRYDWFDINFNNRRGWNIDNDYRDETYGWDSDREYIMTPDGLKKVSDLDPVELKNGHFKIVIDADGNKINVEGDVDENKDKSKYHYKQNESNDSLKQIQIEKLREQMKVRDSIDREKKIKEIIKKNAVNTNGKKTDATEETLTTGSIISPLLIFSEI
jgi:phage shock protein PspC (stress-responsive transcriptional regulator)